MIKLNKTIKTKLISNIIAKKYKKKYESYLAKLSSEVRKVMIKDSFHNEFKALNLSIEMLSLVQAKSQISVYYIDSETVDFISYKRALHLTDPVYGHFGFGSIPSDFKQFVELKELIKIIEREQQKLETIVMAYTSVKKLIHDLPWIEKHLPDEAEKVTAMISIEKLNEASESFGGL